MILQSHSWAYPGLGKKVVWVFVSKITEKILMNFLDNPISGENSNLKIHQHPYVPRSTVYNSQDTGAN